MFMVDQNYGIKQRISQYFAAELITQEWVQPKDAEHLLFTAASDIHDADGHVLVTAYPVLRPDGQWSVMLVNKDYDDARQVRIVFHDSEGNSDDAFEGPVTMITFGKTQYQWHSARKQGYADPDGPAATSTVPGGAKTVYALPPASVTVLRGKTGASPVQKDIRH
jgi:hypothetical protein